MCSSTTYVMDTQVDTEFAAISATLEQWGFGDLQTAFKGAIESPGRALHFQSLSDEELRSIVPQGYERFASFKSTYLQSMAKRRRTELNSSISEQSTTPSSNYPNTLDTIDVTDEVVGLGSDLQLVSSGVSSVSQVTISQEEQALVATSNESNPESTATGSVNLVDEVSDRLQNMSLLLTKYNNIDTYFTENQREHPYYNVLRSTKEGKLILIDILNDVVFDRATRIMICELVVSHELDLTAKTHRPFYLAPEDLRRILQNILKLAPNEKVNASCYYTPGVTTLVTVTGFEPLKSKSRASGHIVKAYEDDRKVLSRKDYICPKSALVLTSPEGLCYAELLYDLLEVPSAHDEDQFIKAWLLKLLFRIKNLYVHRNISEIVSLLPVYEDQRLGPLLIGHDFERVVNKTGHEKECRFKEDIANKFLKYWPVYSPAILRAGQDHLGIVAKRLQNKEDRKINDLYIDIPTDIIIHDSENSSHRDVRALMTLPLLFKASLKRPAKTSWIPTEEDKALCFIEYLENDATLEQVQQFAVSKKLYFEGNGVGSAQPFVVLCGPINKIASSLVLGDNLGLNSLLAYTSSFTNTYCCRICEASPDGIRGMVREILKLIRTKEKYESDILQNCTSRGLTGYSLFNEVPDFHVLKASVDVMHDVFEGVVPTVMSKILIELIVNEKCVKVKDINDVLDKLDFDFEKSNKPLHIKLEYMKANKSLKMSASEALFFVRYFGVMVGHLVDEDLPIWQLYIKLRDLIDILTSPEITESQAVEFGEDVEEFLKKLIDLDETLTIKFHLLVHYLRQLRENGPWIKYSALRFESKHTEIKDILSVVECNKNILKTVGVRLNLSLARFQFEKYEVSHVIRGPSQVNINIHKHFYDAHKKEALKHVTINDICYKLGTIIVVDIHDVEVEFGEISGIYEIDGQIHFEYQTFEYVTFDRRYYAYRVFQNVNNVKVVSFKALACKTPCLKFAIKGSFYITTRYRL
ncbi:hypothetical protein QAD02_011030 [Eretmocerus hayati]|uniref:Uncharacterized protein n=1 Tax=Eretmocerus hayati TaxID=131215 RepID=A0ACC2NY75_9HYME|nr:hypothetical protein QAD02_011030 [Eretmocerus hayati]